MNPPIYPCFAIRPVDGRAVLTTQWPSPTYRSSREGGGETSPLKVGGVDGFRRGEFRIARTFL